LIILSLYFHTLRYLKPQQVIGRAWFRLARPRPNKCPEPPLRSMAGTLCSTARRQASILNAETFRFLNQVGSLAELGWDDARKACGAYRRSKLWRYNQHYFDDLNALDAVKRYHWHLSMLQRWVSENPPGLGMGWEPYPTSLRIVNWVKWQCTGNVLPDDCVHSLAVQARWLTQRLERHILGNHLFANAKALVFAGCFFSGDEADAWLQQGLAIIRKELPEQLLLDGGNFERSPMYHAIFWEDLLDLINLSQAYSDALPATEVASWRMAALLMQSWSHGMTHPDGEIAFFNDAAKGIAPCPEELADYSNRLGLRVQQPNTEKFQHFPNSGYIRIASAQAVAFMDVAPVGPDYLPGHAHADTLSFELSLFGQRVVTNGGTSEYGTGMIRQLERGTAAHSTVTINGESSSEVWGGFRVARRAYPSDLTIDERKECITVRCSHNGYRRLPGKPVHQREWQWSDSALQVMDTVCGSVEHAVARFHLHPDIYAVESARSCWTLTLPGGQSVQMIVEHGIATLKESYYAPEFGKRILRACLAVELIDKRSQVRFVWETSH
jgi:uncharacterized heparinase superfamily protein